MQAVIITGGKQYRVEAGQTLKVAKLPNAVGDSVSFEQVLLLSNGQSEVQIGSPFIQNAHVTAEVIDQGRFPKIHIIKMRRRKHYMRRQGHRQDFTEIKINEINA